jgi:hypothetical protein
VAVGSGRRHAGGHSAEEVEEALSTQHSALSTQHSALSTQHSAFILTLVILSGVRTGVEERAILITDNWLLTTVLSS